MAASLDLEDSYQGSTGPVALVACHRAYTVDVGKMEQTNDTTGVVRKVKRITVKGILTNIFVCSVEILVW